MKHNWYNQSYRRILVDMHIADWNEKFFSKINPKEYAAMMKLSGIDTAIIYAGSCLGICNWPTKHGYMHKQLKGRDLFGELVAECRKKKLNVVGYFNIWSRWAYDTHPEWRIILPNGKGTVEDGWRYGLCCQNTGYFDYVMKMIGELGSAYRPDGLWVDMIGWFSKICVCEGCRNRFRKETGKEIPDEIDWTNKDWVVFQRKREEWLAEFAYAIVAAAKQANPEMTVTLQNTSMFPGWGGGAALSFSQAGDYLAGDFYGNSTQISFVCKLLNSLSKDHPIEFMTSRCEDLSCHTTGKNLDTMMMQAFAALANNACFVLIDAIDPEGTLDHRFYNNARKVFQQIKKYTRYLAPDAEILADTAIYYSFESMYDPGQNKKRLVEFTACETGPQKRIMNIVKTLSQHHIPFAFVSKKDLGKLSRYKTIILSNAMQMDNEECEVFRKYVKNGGSLYSSSGSSLYRKNGELTENFQLADVFGVSFIEEAGETLSYVTPVVKSPLSKFCSEKSPLQIDGKLLTIRAEKGTKTLAAITLPFTDPADNDRFSSAISNPPGIPTSKPALVRNRLGKGISVYSAVELETPAFNLHRDVFAEIIKSIGGKIPLLQTDAPKQIEITIYDDEKSKRLIINLLNYQETLPPVSAHNINVKIHLEAQYPVKLISAPDGKEVEYNSIDAHTIEFKAELVEMFRMFILTYK
ncbi:MAG: alpha-L-fucosidase [Victivallales bacterium]|nr:alpha-L-fucosidase [Victivallales bacterium]